MKEVLAGEKAYNATGEWLPQETVDAFSEYLVGIKGPLTTPVGGGIRSLNVALRQLMDLYVCIRPVRWFAGVPSPVKRPGDVDMVIFRENTEDVYAGKELEAGSDDAAKLMAFLKENYGWEIKPDSGLGLKPISVSGSKRLIRAAIQYAIANGRSSVTLVHKGNIMKFTEVRSVLWLRGGERRVLGRVGFLGGLWRRSRRQDLDSRRHCRRHAAAGLDPPGELRRYRHDEPQRRLHFRCFGGPGRWYWHRTWWQHQLRDGCAVFEATHGTAPKYAGMDKVKPRVCDPVC